MRKCENCKKNEAIWAVQSIGGRVSAYALGWQMRGFKTIRVCDDCIAETRKKMERENE